MLSIKKIVVLVLLIVLAIGSYWVYRNFLYWSGWYGKPASFEELVENWAKLDNIPGTILHITKDGEPVYVGSSGSLALQSEQATNFKVHFHTASTGKIFTTLAVLKLYEKGVLSLDEPVSPYVDEELLSGLVVIDGQDFSSEITFRHLVTHRSGLPNTDNSLSFQYYVLSQLERKRNP